MIFFYLNLISTYNNEQFKISNNVSKEMYQLDANNFTMILFS